MGNVGLVEGGIEVFYEVGGVFVVWWFDMLFGEFEILGVYLDFVDFVFI